MIQTEVMRRPLPVGINSLAKKCSNNEVKRQLPEQYTFDTWAVLDPVDRDELVWMESIIPSSEARIEGKAVGGGRKVAMRFWFAMLLQEDVIHGIGARYFYRKFSTINGWDM